MNPLLVAASTAQGRQASKALALAGAVSALLVGGLVAGGGGENARAAACGQVGGLPSSVVGTPVGAASLQAVFKSDTTRLAEAQKHAGQIIAIGRQRGVPARGWVVAIAAGMQESKLQNLTGGHLDSLGLFQMRPSQGWGTAQQITDTTYAINKFYDVLLKVPGWQQMTTAEAAQAVERSGFPDAYQAWEHIALDLVRASGQDVGPATSTTAGPTSTATVTAFPGPSTSTAPTTVGPSGATTSSPGAGDLSDLCPDQGGGPVVTGTSSGVFQNGSEVIPLPRANPRDLAGAIAFAQAEAAHSSQSWHQRCLNFTARAWGWSSAGTTYAIDHFYATPASMRREGDRNPPPGALLYWKTGHRAGHVALYVGNGMVASNDILVDGRISIVPAELIEQKWGSTYVGWGAPYYPNAG